MPYALHRHAPIVEVDFTGVVVADELRVAVREVTALPPERIAERRLLFHFSERPPAADLSPIEVFTLIDEMDRLGLRRSDWVAVVTRPYAERAWATTVGLNRGWSRMRYFDDLASARAWLTNPTAE